MAPYLDAPKTYADIRSPSRPEALSQKQLAKYYAYRGVHPSWVGQMVSYDPVHRDCCTSSRPCKATFISRSNASIATDPRQIKVRTWTKRDQWLNRDYDIWPLDVQHSKGRRNRGRGCNYVPSRWNYERSTRGRLSGLFWIMDEGEITGERWKEEIVRGDLEREFDSEAKELEASADGKAALLMDCERDEEEVLIQGGCGDCDNIGTTLVDARADFDILSDLSSVVASDELEEDDWLVLRSE